MAENIANAVTGEIFCFIFLLQLIFTFIKSKPFKLHVKLVKY